MPRSFMKAFVFACCFVASMGRADDIPQYKTAPKFYEFLPNAFMDVPHALANANPVEHWQAYAGILGLTGILYHYDEDLIQGSQRFAMKRGIITEADHGGESRVVFTTKVAGVDADLRLPKGPNGHMYYIGDGITSLTIAAGLLAYGGITSDLRALNTTSQLMESLILTGMFSFTSKYIAGRESPFRATMPRGRWRPVPGFKAYFKNVSKHDAYPSGHVATVMSTVMILHQNYPEKAWILPVGYTSLGLLMFAMLNNGVHWASDYPLGIAYGYLAAKTVFELRRPKATSEVIQESRRPRTRYSLMPFATAEGIGLSLEIKS